jgi:hypothetical protein
MPSQMQQQPDCQVLVGVSQCPLTACCCSDLQFPLDTERIHSMRPHCACTLSMPKMSSSAALPPIAVSMWAKHSWIEADARIQNWFKSAS